MSHLLVSQPQEMLIFLLTETSHKILKNTESAKMISLCVLLNAELTQVKNKPGSSCYVCAALCL